MIDVNFFQILLIILLYFQITIVTYEIYYHRGISHGGIIFSPSITFLFEFWAWLTFGSSMPNKYILRSSHRIHHAYADTDNDIHGPVALGVVGQFVNKPFRRTISQFINTFMFSKKEKYPPTELQKKFLDNLENFNDESLFYRNRQYGNFIFLIVNILLFGINGFYIYLLFLIQNNLMRDIIFDGVSHLIGYRNYNIKDNSKNIFFIGIFFCGGELHNNHHRYPNDIKLSKKWFEIDIGWLYIKLLEFFKLCKITNV
jgi:fatty-acid desaturase